MACEMPKIYKKKLSRMALGQGLQRPLPLSLPPHGQILIYIGLVNSPHSTLVTPWDHAPSNLCIPQRLFKQQADSLGLPSSLSLKYSPKFHTLHMGAAGLPVICDFCCVSNAFCSALVLNLNLH